MKQKLVVFIIAIALSIAQGLATESMLIRGDVDGNGQITIADVSEIINVILEGHDNMHADINEDGQVTIADLSELIDIILCGPDLRLCTYLLVSLENGNTNEYLADGNTKVNIVKPNLVIEADGQVITYLLSEVKQLRYENRVVSFDDRLALNSMIDDDTQTLEIEQP